jgi:PHD/YefM family antitoxin component YafN of YafNO toxin-antitoxin module
MIVPITRFNRGEASKIFDEVNENGVKVVLKNNVPACVLVKPEQYDAMIEALEDYALFFEAERRMSGAAERGFVSSEKLKSDLGITDTDISDAVVDIE